MVQAILRERYYLSEIHPTICRSRCGVVNAENDEEFDGRPLLRKTVWFVHDRGSDLHDASKVGQAA